MKDFLYIYNKMAETCFNQCIENFNGRQLTPTEESCIEKCSSKGVAVNHRLMMSYMEIQPEIMNKRVEEMQKQQANIDALNNQVPVTPQNA
ncbi:mitochondrial import inner membrane translocase subunit Tim10 B isoform X2 [Parasteatoda tepidariorum]|nr:mitochondrial import inner membrane translocase subunit Tim10 B isoform X2 [Parasteatoda tepidariorum]XP_042896862.1 mitochondrial import inner membrane translocase subunit Tim10 B isoform X2 [Parasteatoda tepidariorum]XP_042896863.1 mitochondrial import inner membrane translocase subunit Tim10 B isoform X2 [Parasteatoda tepidariorum]XP_042896864.1 mitochondrial import inner membrane translocase subunit Tim10 B isoform X2 [Parasteatoda tepidariorum]